MVRSPVLACGCHAALLGGWLAWYYLAELIGLIADRLLVFVAGYRQLRGLRGAVGTLDVCAPRDLLRRDEQQLHPSSSSSRDEPLPPLLWWESFVGGLVCGSQRVACLLSRMSGQLRVVRALN